MFLNTSISWSQFKLFINSQLLNLSLHPFHFTRYSAHCLVICKCFPSSLSTSYSAPRLTHTTLLFWTFSCMGKLLFVTKKQKASLAIKYVNSYLYTRCNRLYCCKNLLWVSDDYCFALFSFSNSLYRTFWRINYILKLLMLWWSFY